jgi:hypothetical protein
MRFAVFMFSSYYPRGGWNDLVYVAPSLAMAEAHILENFDDEIANFQIVDLEAREVLKAGGFKGKEKPKDDRAVLFSSKFTKAQGWYIPVNAAGTWKDSNIEFPNKGKAFQEPVWAVELEIVHELPDETLCKPEKVYLHFESRRAADFWSNSFKAALSFVIPGEKVLMEQVPIAIAYLLPKKCLDHYKTYYMIRGDFPVFWIDSEGNYLHPDLLGKG